MKYGVVSDNGYDTSVRWFEELEDAIEHYEDLNTYSTNIYIVEKITVDVTYKTKDGTSIKHSTQ